MENKKVIDILAKCGSLLEGHFLLTSGKHSDRYCQCAKVLEDPKSAKEVFSVVAEQVKDKGATIVLGPAMGGIVAAYELGRQLGLHAVFTERTDGKMELRRGFVLSPEDKVLIVEDVVTTGKSTLETAEVIESFGAKVIGLCCIVDRRPEGFELPFPIYSATTLKVKTFEKDDCPLCTENIPIVKPGSRKIK